MFVRFKWRDFLIGCPFEYFINIKCYTNFMFEIMHSGFSLIVYLVSAGYFHQLHHVILQSAVCHLASLQLSFEG